MGTIAGIIAEYDPFHLGHAYQIQATRERAGAEYIVVVMSGDFVQRGEPAIFAKSERTRMALLGGADLVLELPAPFALGSAEDFSAGAVSLLDRLGAVDLLSFGSECGELAPLKGAAQILAQESPAFKRTLKEHLRRGLSFPLARLAALKASGASEEALLALDGPNNLLGIEYLKAIWRQKSPMEAFTIKRDGQGYHDRLLPTEGEERSASATALRKAIFALWPAWQDRPPFPPSKEPSGQPDHRSSNGTAERAAADRLPSQALAQLLGQLPPQLHPLYTSGRLLPIHPDDCSALLNYQILSCLREGTPFQDYFDISPELAGRLAKNCTRPRSFSGQVEALKTRQYTYTRISRSLLHLLLHIRKADMELYRRSGYCSYARVLGFKRSAAPLMRAIKEKSSIPLIAKAADAPRLLPPDALRLWEQDIYCSHVYHGLVQQRYGITLADEYRRPILAL